MREPCERHNVDVAAPKKNKRGIGVTPEFLAHLTFTHCGGSVMKLMGRHPELYDLSLGTRDSIVGQGKHCLGCMIAKIRPGARACITTSWPSLLRLQVNVITPTWLALPVLWESDRPNTFLLLSMSTHDTCMSFQCAERVRQPLCLHSCLNAFVYKLFDRTTLVY